MRVEGCDLVDLGLRKLHLGGKRGKVGGGDMAVFVLDEMQMLDQQVAAARPVGEQSFDVGRRDRIDLAAFRRASGRRRPPCRLGPVLKSAAVP